MPNNVLYIFCEGHTENAVLKNFLRNYWEIRFSDCEVIRYSGAGDLMAKFVTDAIHIFRTEPEASVVCLLDLYEEPFEVYDKNKMTHAEGFVAVKEQLDARIKYEYSHRFGAFPIVMEIETWLLADPKVQSQINQYYPSPESIEHPAQEFKKWQGNYNKRIDGTNLFNNSSYAVM